MALASFLLSGLMIFVIFKLFKQFAVSIRPILNGILKKGFTIIDVKEYYPYIDDKKKFARVLIQNKNL